MAIWGSLQGKGRKKYFLNFLRNPLSFGEQNTCANGMPCRKANLVANQYLGNEKLIVVVIVATNTVLYFLKCCGI